ncbi:homoserine/threonine efflux transporter [Entomohabitans teleogrylli]|uniref:homoserine/threonine efflux transporter n=1 Tax=Entomohabitans teleogrylli TaxID=1384589 RepID=UPI00073D8E3B|nr:homoserine/threonine efflux transporter [Entomohabitans teleogrylli]
MDPIHGVLVTVGLFMLTFLNPGANLFIVVQTTLSSGRRAGLLCGCGVVLGNAIYSGLGLFGMIALMTRFESLFAVIKIAGGLYLMWYAWGVVRNRQAMAISGLQKPQGGSALGFFRRGLISDLSNPQTVLFFIGIFSVTLTPQTPLWAKLVTWAALIVVSFLWRLLLCQTFSREVVRRAYGRIHRVASGVIGCVVGAMAARLIWQGVRELR